jgi:hypothetical protein
MSIKVRPYARRGQKSEGWEVDIQVRRVSGERIRERVRAPVTIRSRSAAMRWAEQRAANLIEKGKEVPAEKEVVKEIPTVEAFAPRFIEKYAKAERQKPSGISTKECLLRVHILPALGDKRLDEVMTEDVQSLKASMASKKPKTVNNVVSVLGKMLRVAVEWGVIDELPCRFGLQKNQAPEMGFFDFAEYGKLVEAAEKTGRHALLAVLLGGDAGLRARMDHGAAVAMEVSRRLAEGWAVTPGADDDQTRRRAEGTSPFERSASALHRRQRARDTEGAANVDGAGSETRRGASVGSGAHPPPHVLLPSRDERGNRDGDQGARRSREPDDHDALHAPVTRSAGLGDPIAKPPRKWRHFGGGQRRKIKAE